MIYSEKYADLLASARKHLDQADSVTIDGDLWFAKLEVDNAIVNLTEASELLLEVSKVAFERVFNK